MPTVPTLIAAANLAQAPIRAGGVLGAGSAQPFLVTASFQTASGGMPAVGRIIPSGAGAATGVESRVAYQGFGATLIGTGLYAITHPPSQNALWWGNVSAPSGLFYNVTQQYKRGDSVSGLTFFQLGQNANGSGFIQPANPPTGTRIDLYTWVAPRNDQNITRF